MNKITPQLKYRAKVIVRKELNFNKNTDKQILEKINAVKNFQGYVKKIIELDEKIFKDF